MAYRTEIVGANGFGKLSSGARFFAVACAILLVTAASAVAQNRTLGEIQGIVTDQNGASIVGAAVTISNTQTGVNTAVKTNDSGVYDANALVPGTYTISVNKEAFKTYVKSNVLVNTEAINVNVALEVGATTDEVKVMAEATTLQTQSAEQLLDISSEMVAKLPDLIPSSGEHAGELNFLTLVPGIQPGGGMGSAGGQTLNNDEWHAMNGGQVATQNWTVNGGSRMAAGQTPGYAEVAPDAIASVNYVSGNFGAEFGLGYAQFNTDTKTGTNQFHGSAFENVQNTMFKARNYYSPVAPITPFHWNYYGGTVGGPILKGKAFFFFSYIHMPVSNTVPHYYTYPTVAMDNGDFSGVPVTVYNPSSLITVGGVSTRTPLAGNIMSPSMIDPVAKNIAQYISRPNYPFPNQSTCATASGVLPDQCFINNTYWTEGTAAPGTFYTSRGDYDLSPTNRLDASYLYDGTNITDTPNPGGGLNGDYTWDEYAHTAQISDFWTISPSLTNEVRIAFERQAIHANPMGYSPGWNQKIGLNGSESAYFPSISWSGYAGGGFGSSFNIGYTDNVFVPSDSLVWVKGKHVLRFGGEFDRFQHDASWNSNEGFNFSGIDTRNPADPASTGVGYADFLFGGVSNWGVYTTPESAQRGWNAGAFVQDDYKVKPSLTVNIGLRYEAIGAWNEAQNRVANYNPNLINPLTGTFGAMCYGANTPGCPTQPTINNIFDPRVGFAWQPKANWSVRGGYGLYAPPNGAGSYSSSGTELGWSTQGSLNNTDNITPVFLLHQGIPAGSYLDPSPANRQPYSQNGFSVPYQPYHVRLAITQQYRVSVQRTIGAYLFEATYVGMRADKLMQQRSINQVPKSLLSTAANSSNPNQYRPNPTFLSINTQLTDGYARYNALQVGVRKQFGSGLSLVVNYAYSRTMDTGTGAPTSGGINIDAMQNLNDVKANYAHSTTDVPNTLVVAVSYPLPVGHGKKFLNQGGVTDAVLGGWNLSTVYSGHSGTTSTPLVGSDNLSGGQDGNWFPNLGGSWKPAHQTPDTWINPSAFTVPSTGTFGNSGRTILRGPAYNNVDLSVNKSFRLPMLGEAGAFQLRADATDAFNHANFFLWPTTSVVGNGYTGQVAGAGTQRNMQFGAKVTF